MCLKRLLPLVGGRSAWGMLQVMRSMFPSSTIAKTMAEGTLKARIARLPRHHAALSPPFLCCCKSKRREAPPALVLTVMVPCATRVAHQESQALNELLFYIRADDVGKCKQVVKREKIKCAWKPRRNGTREFAPRAPHLTTDAPPGSAPADAAHIIPRYHAEAASCRADRAPSLHRSLHSSKCADSDGKTPLHVASTSNAKRCVEWLIKEGVEVRGFASACLALWWPCVAALTG